MEILFHLKNGWYVNRTDDIEVRVRFNNTSWCIHWVRYSLMNSCTVKGWCARHRCDIYKIRKKNYDADNECCFQCSEDAVEVEDEDSYTSNGWSEKPADLEEARLLIMERYEYLLHGGMYPINPALKRIMVRTWMHKAVVNPFSNPTESVALG